MNALTPQDFIAVIGAGAMGSGIAQVALDAGHRVALYDAAPAALERGIGAIDAAYRRLRDKGRIDAATHAARMARLVRAGGVADLAGAALVIEAIVEDIDVKARVLAEVEAVLDDDAIVATNTSSLSVTALGARLRRPARVAGLHFFNPAPVLPLVEIVSGKATDPAVADTLFATARAWNKVPVRCASTPGFIVNRVARPFYGEALRLLAERAADAATLDAILRDCGGFRMGAFELMDMIGHDVNYAVTRSVYDALYQDPRYKPSLLQRELVDAGWLGRKSGRGFHRYGDDAARPAPVLAAPAPRPSAVVVEGDLGVAAPLARLAADAGLAVRHVPGARALLRVDGVALALTDGRGATRRLAADPQDAAVVFDLAFDYAGAAVIAVAVADQAPAGALDAAVGFFQALGKQVAVVDDAPGLVVMRTVAMLANEAADVVQQGIASAADTDLAMTGGVNYPRGPLAWADLVGPAPLQRVLANLAAAYGEDRYRTSPLLLRRALAGQPFHAPAAAPERAA
ncbi:3-hydroxyacyl-CoA dehydrogenase [uncultured Massilia sp.]|uniref:3-hydroxyacyl-CoA dehydrogenase n=1 Tax=uncultured Massilia sp. TaxID=169973 RepID=UPI0025F9B821|nr:3-hydroxyacyl-CoA dehydrogenase [uncultured Massilia sp.]